MASFKVINLLRDNVCSLCAMEFGYNLSYTKIMKTAISIPDSIFQAAEKFARQEKMSRSELYTTALTVYLAHQQVANITAKLNEIYAVAESKLDDEWLDAQTSILTREQW